MAYKSCNPLICIGVCNVAHWIVPRALAKGGGEKFYPWRGRRNGTEAFIKFYDEEKTQMTLTPFL
jgi:hypothetical protein